MSKNNKNNNIKIKDYYNNNIYKVIWDNSYPFPCLIINISDIPKKYIKDYENCIEENKIPVKYFCATDEEDK